MTICQLLRLKCVNQATFDLLLISKFSVNLMTVFNLILYLHTYSIISILVPPMFWIPNQLEGAYVGQDITLECHSEAFPPSINYWEKEDGHTLVSGKS